LYQVPISGATDVNQSISGGSFMAVLATYVIYLLITLTVVFKVGNLLNRNGLMFLEDQLDGNTPLAQAINNLLLIGFYLINIGYILLVINLRGFTPGAVGIDLYACLHFLTENLGLVLIMLGALHMLLLYLLSNWRPDNRPRGNSANQSGDKI
jgi:hypothetical protein